MGTGDWTAKATGFYIADEDTSQASLQNAIINGTTFVAQFQLGAGRGYLEGTVDVTQMTVGNNVKNAQSVDWSMVGNGSIQPSPS